MTNPLDEDDGHFLVVVNDEGQHALWPAATDVPAGWTAVHDPANPLGREVRPCPERSTSPARFWPRWSTPRGPA